MMDGDTILVSETISLPDADVRVLADLAGACAVQGADGWAEAAPQLEGFLARLRRQGLAESAGAQWRITTKGRAVLAALAGWR